MGVDDNRAVHRGEQRTDVPLGGGAGEAFPVGSVFIAVVSTDPATLLGYGTWAAFGAGRVMVGLNAGDADFDAAEKTGGAKTVSAAGSVAAPALSGSTAAEAAHTHGVTSNVAVNDHASHTHTYTEVPNHTHPVNITDSGHSHLTQRYPNATGASSGFTIDTSMSGTLTDNTLPTKAATTGITATTSNPGGGVPTGTTAGPSAALSHAVTNTPVTSGAGSSHSHGTGTLAASAPAFTGSPTSVVQPYVVCYFWKRTA